MVSAAPGTSWGEELPGILGGEDTWLSFHFVDVRYGWLSTDWMLALAD